MYITEVENVGKCTGGVKMGGEVETVETIGIVISHSLVNYTSRNIKSFKLLLFAYSDYLCGASNPTT
jgi:hypothetical protein